MKKLLVGLIFGVMGLSIFAEPSMPWDHIGYKAFDIQEKSKAIWLGEIDEGSVRAIDSTSDKGLLIVDPSRTNGSNAAFIYWDKEGYGGV